MHLDVMVLPGYEPGTVIDFVGRNAEMFANTGLIILMY